MADCINKIYALCKRRPSATPNTLDLGISQWRSSIGEEGFSCQLRNSSLSWEPNSSSATETPLSESTGQASPTNLIPRVQPRVTFSTTKATDSPLEYTRMYEQPHPFGARTLLWERNRNSQNVKGRLNTNLTMLVVNSLLPHVLLEASGNHLGTYFHAPRRNEARVEKPVIYT